MNLFKLPRYTWWENMKLLMENVNLTDMLMMQNNRIKFNFSNSYNGVFYKSLDCSGILKCCIENDFYEDEVFSYFISDIFVKELSKEEMESSLTYYKYGFNVNLSELGKLYLISIHGNEICIDIICKKYELLAQ